MSAPSRTPPPPEPLSPRNPRVVGLGRLARQRRARDAEDRFVVDGPVLLGDAVRDGVVVEDVFVDPEAADRPEVEAAVAAAVAAGGRAWTVTGGLRPHVEVATPHGVAAVARRPEGVTRPGRGTAPLHVVLVGVADPGNVGTLLRTAEAVGAASLVVGEGTADPWAPKVVRASAGSVWRVPLRAEPVGEALERLAAEGVARVGTSGGDGVAPHLLDLRGPVALVLGNEAHGLPAAVAPGIDSWATLPMEGAVESLNVAVAGSVLAFEVVRQRAVEAAP
ncbi:RNA methyltransferase [Iamia sp. SCSIO 61187]|uniref:TrmH family RNA methyltransferase n=1 Tax=Iamia sp. SCSIO 61187 TaxID=2722752 RepID=UPI001C63A7D4|nr:RNA methyltransferase [Iamia sp. SCSIO 61187]QYG93058.1 RNA methyltransferase [Iamia sp. SCSIO 61187]